MAIILGLPLDAGAQSTESVGTRAQGMGGAFVGVADDASAVYWNPAGLAGGAYFSLLLDGNTARSVPDADPVGADRSGWILALSMPALGLSYTRLQSTTVRPAIGIPENSRLESLVTHQIGATLVQSIVDQHCRRGDRETGPRHRRLRDVAGNDREELLDHIDLIGHSSTRVDLDVGVMAVGLVRQGRPDGSEPHRSYIRHRPRRGVAARTPGPGGRVGAAPAGVEAGGRHRSDEQIAAFSGTSVSSRSARKGR